MRRLTLVILFAALVAACSSSGDSSAPASSSTTTSSTTTPRCTGTTEAGLERIDLTVKGKPRTALVHLPSGWDGKTQVPVILSFHGLGSDASQQRTNDGLVARSDGDADKFIVVHPEASGTLGKLGSAWDLKGDTEIRFVTALLNDLEQRACVDVTRVYATGLSYGGAMTDLLACNLADRIAAAAPVSAYLPKRKCTPSRPVPMISFHGVEDSLLPYEGGGKSSQVPFEEWGKSWAKRDGCASRPTEKQYEATVEEIKYSGCRAPVDLYRVHENGHTWPGHPLGLPRAALIDYFSGKSTGKPYPLMVALDLTPEEFADSILLANQDIDASDMILRFFRQHRL